MGTPQGQPSKPMIDNQQNILNKNMASALDNLIFYFTFSKPFCHVKMRVKQNLHVASPHKKFGSDLGTVFCPNFTLKWQFNFWQESKFFWAKTIKSLRILLKSKGFMTISHHFLYLTLKSFFTLLNSNSFLHCLPSKF